MNLMQIAAVAGIILCLIFFAGLVIAAVIDNGRIKREAESYKAGWASWGDITDVKAGRNE